jgi:hypothetical protein
MATTKTGNAAVDAYGGSGASSTFLATTQPQAEVAKDSGPLPFTGTDLGLIAGGGLVLVAFGVAMRKFAARPSATPV